jgi:hypothetical protein
MQLLVALRTPGRDVVIEIAALQRVFFQCEVHVGAQVVDPELLRPGLFLRGFAVEEQNIGLHALRAENAGGQAQQRMPPPVWQIAVNGLARAALLPATALQIAVVPFQSVWISFCSSKPAMVCSKAWVACAMSSWVWAAQRTPPWNSSDPRRDGVGGADIR